MDFTSLNLNELSAERNTRLILLSQSDYKSLKAYEGDPSDDWDDVKASRRTWRDDIEVIESMIALRRSLGEIEDV